VQRPVYHCWDWELGGAGDSSPRREREPATFPRPRSDPIITRIALLQPTEDWEKK